MLNPHHEAEKKKITGLCFIRQSDIEKVHETRILTSAASIWPPCYEHMHSKYAMYMVRMLGRSSIYTWSEPTPNSV